VSVTVSRRHVLATVALLATGRCAGNDAPPGKSGTSSEAPGAGAMSPFSRLSTAEEVTASLDLSGKTALVTGATSGLGLETLRVLAMRGAHVFATGRTLARATTVCNQVAPGRATPLALDLEDWDGVIAAARRVRAMARPLDIMVCNAGIMAPPTLTLVNGVEQQFAVNHLGHFLLHHHVADLLLAAPQGRVVVVSSNALAWAPAAGIDFDNLAGERGYAAGQMYGQSKLANWLFTVELARRRQGTPVTANALHPGVILTNLDRYGSVLGRLRARVMRWNNPGLKSVAAGAATQVFLATAPAVATVSGKFFADCNPVALEGPHVDDVALAAALWTKSEELTRGYLS
jgi:NAD(P)-dependent dehydrogenase (short-subunit alcohol dehydrogenase family)